MQFVLKAVVNQAQVDHAALLDMVVLLVVYTYQRLECQAPHHDNKAELT